MDPVLYWNSVLLEASRRDFTRGFPNGQQPGPIRTTRAMAIVHLAIHDAVAFQGGQAAKSYLARKAPGHGIVAPPAGMALEDVIAGAASEAIKAMYPKSAQLVDDFTGPATGPAFAYGQLIAQALIAYRASDGWNVMLADDQKPNPSAPGHRADPYQPGQRRLGPVWGNVTRFTTTAPAGYHQPLNPYPTGPDYKTDFIEVRDYGAATRNRRSAEQERIGVFWGYDGANGLGVPPRLYNQVARKIVVGKPFTTAQLADLFARINVAMADAGIDAWHWKYHYDLWRPVVGVRLESGNDSDPFWAPYGVPRTNNTRATFTPDFPAYPSGHATFGAALFQVLRLAMATAGGAIQLQDVLAVDSAITAKKVPPKVAKETFTFVSDELDGTTVDPDGSPRTRVEKTFNSFAEAVWENSVSRIYLGVHWRFDGIPRTDVAGQRIGGVPLGLAIGQEANQFFTGGPGAISNLP